MSQIQGMFPGGPRRKGDASEPHRPLRSGEDVEASITDHTLEVKASRKRRSMFIGLGAIAVLALTAGLYIGIQARVTAEELAEQQRAEAEASDFDEYTKSVMDELWKMEKVEAVRNRR